MKSAAHALPPGLDELLEDCACVVRTCLRIRHSIDFTKVRCWWLLPGNCAGLYPLINQHRDTWVDVKTHTQTFCDVQVSKTRHQPTFFNILAYNVFYSIISVIEQNPVNDLGSTHFSDWLVSLTTHTHTHTHTLTHTHIYTHRSCLRNIVEKWAYFCWWATIHLLCCLPNVVPWL